MTRYAFVNTLTLSRAPLALLAVACSLLNLACPSWGWIVATAVLLALSALTDLFDGKLARKWGVVSRFGALADPLMDKVFYILPLPTATFLALYSEDVVHASVLLALDIVSIGRDLWVSFLRAATAGTSAKMGASWAGKIRTALAFPVIAIVHLALGIRVLALHEKTSLVLPSAPLYALEAVILAATLWSAVSYTRYYLPFLTDAKKCA